ncbi:hypothetical protein N7470_003720 [Penicillium chermesinum]|nr:hypothetical protein N7470_003720 [Penicillium chermesinum]
METDAVVVGKQLHRWDLVRAGMLKRNIAGNGPSAMILSYILHGHIPYYTSDPPHPDPLLDAKLQSTPNILQADVDALTAHFAASRLSYSTQALPINVLLDTLVRPSLDIDVSSDDSNVEWRHMPEKAVPHLVWDIQTLSYAAMLSLPGYSFAEHYQKLTGQELPPYTRPTRREITDYFQSYPAAAQIDDVFRCGEELSGITRTATGFYIKSHDLHCKRLVLASGIFSKALPPGPVLRPLLQTSSTPAVPLLVIGSGFSAADAILSASPDQKILHVFRWSPEDRPSPLRGCHQQAYPEYAGVYRLMKRAALDAAETEGNRPKTRRVTSTGFWESRDWSQLYEGVANVEVTAVDVKNESAIVTFRRADGSEFSRTVAGLVYAAGRRGSLSYLDTELSAEVLGQAGAVNAPISAQTLRAKAYENLEIAPGVHIIGSLTGDSLVRFAYGGCVDAARHIIHGSTSQHQSPSTCGSAGTSHPHSPSLTVMNGIDGHQVYPDGTSELTREETLSKASTKGSSFGWWAAVRNMWRDLIR